MTPRKRLGIARLFGAAVADQVVLSGANFFVGLLLIRHTTDSDYGLYVLVQSALLLLVTALNAWLGGPLAVLAPKRSPEQRREMFGAVAVSLRRFVRVLGPVLLVLTAIGFALGLYSGVIALVIAGAVLAGLVTLHREFLRGMFLIYGRPHLLLRADIVYAAVLVVAVVCAAFGPKPAAIGVTVALGIAALAGERYAHRTLARDPGWTSQSSVQFWPDIRRLGLWSGVGALIFWVYSQGYNYVLASRLNLAAVADVNAARLLLMPTVMLTVGIKSLLTPSAAGWLVEFGIRPVVRRLLMAIACVAVLDLLYFVVIWFLRDWLTGDLLHKSIGNRDQLLILWCVVSLIGLSRDLLLVALYALERFRELAWLTAASAVICLSVMWLTIEPLGASAVLIGQISGESVGLLGLIVVLRRTMVRLAQPGQVKE